MADAASCTEGEHSCSSDASRASDASALVDAAFCVQGEPGCSANSVRDAGRAADAAREAPDEPDADDVETADRCPNDPYKTAPGMCGCGVADRDSDRDGVADCRDGCPQDPDKTVPGVCGCALADTDADHDGTADCLDGCPKDPKKTSPGACGCAAVDVDSDKDGTADCVDGCPQDSAKTSPGVCGCGATDPALASVGDIYCVKVQLLHRYSFDGSGTTAIDSIAGANASVFGGANANMSGGALALSGSTATGYSNEGYVSLPTSVWQGLASATFEVWIDWRGAAPRSDSTWQRVFDFGDEVANKAHSYLYLTPSGDGGVRTAYSLDGNAASEVSVVSPSPSPLNVVQHIAVVVDAASSTLSLYLDGAAQGSTHMPGKLSDITIQDLWLGRSHFPNDPELFGSLLEFRIYGAALTNSQIKASSAAGPDYVFAP
jgi:hypothetical protein